MFKNVENKSRVCGSAFFGSSAVFFINVYKKQVSQKLQKQFYGSGEAEETLYLREKSGTAKSTALALFYPKKALPKSTTKKSRS